MADETIYDLIPFKPSPEVKQPRYQSVFHDAVREESKHQKASMKTMGLMKSNLNDTKNFLKKKEKEPKLPEKKPFVRGDDDKKKPPVPKRDEKPVFGIKSNKDFIHTNAVDNIMSVAKKPEGRYVATKGGAIYTLENSGLVPKYTTKDGYGTVPKYLTDRKRTIEEHQKAYDDYITQQREKNALHKISATEREEILSGLKNNWTELHLQYQGLSVITDTAPKKAKKERLEAQMNQIERDIATIEKHSVIYVSDAL